MAVGFHEVAMLVQRIMAANVIGICALDFSGVSPHAPIQGFISLITSLTMLLPHWTILCLTIDFIILPVCIGRAYEELPYCWLAGIGVCNIFLAMALQSIQLWWLEEEDDEEEEAKVKAQQKKKH
mmetsp:Transcript_9510/g.19177  ORF Transcript_9510/g.19177 Transcript_9510/m.19177 type:complete len:125 (-) Transcript_9510:111-485(-)